MGIHNLYKENFVHETQKIVGKEAGIKKPHNIKSNQSFRDDLDLNSLDVADICVSVSEKYNIDFLSTRVNSIDSINDIYNAMVDAIQKQRAQNTK